MSFIESSFTDPRIFIETIKLLTTFNLWFLDLHMEYNEFR